MLALLVCLLVAGGGLERILGRVGTSLDNGSGLDVTGGGGRSSACGFGFFHLQGCKRRTRKRRLLVRARRLTVAGNSNLLTILIKGLLGGLALDLSTGRTFAAPRGGVLGLVMKRLHDGDGGPLPTISTTILGGWRSANHGSSR